MTDLTYSLSAPEDHSSAIYADDYLLAGDTYKDCLDNIHETKLLLETLSFYIHPKKSVFLPTQVITFIGFEINTTNKTISLTNAKKNKIKNLCVNALRNSTLTIHQVASLLRNIAASFEAGPYGRLHYRYLEQNKIMVLREARRNFESPCIITPEASKDIIWWRDNILDAIASLYPTPEVDLTIFTYASNKGWGASTNDQTINGRLNEPQKFLHINELELLAIRHAVFSFMSLFSNAKPLRIMIDNITSVSYINKPGGTHSLMCNKLTIEIWEICIKHLSHLSAANIPSKQILLQT